MRTIGGGDFSMLGLLFLVRVARDGGSGSNSGRLFLAYWPGGEKRIESAGGWMRMQKRMDNSGWQADGWAWANDMR
jgi:hypothetical protein